MRNIKSNLTADDARAIAEITTHAKLQEAVGYLCMWAPDAYAAVTLYANPRDAEIIACYYRGVSAGAERPDYVIGAVWHADSDEPGAGHYGFHS